MTALLQRWDVVGWVGDYSMAKSQGSQILDDGFNPQVTRKWLRWIVVTPVCQLRLHLLERRFGG